MLLRTLVFAGCLGVCCRAFRARIVGMLPRAMVPRARPNGLDVSRGGAHSYVAAHPWCRALECRRASVLPSTRAAAPLSMLPRSYTCCRAPMVPRAEERYVVLVCVAASHVAAQFSVWTRPMLPRSSLCCRVPCCRAVLCVAASHVAAQFYVRPRLAPWCRARHNASSLPVAASHVAAQFYVLPRSMFIYSIVESAELLEWRL